MRNLLKVSLIVLLASFTFVSQAQVKFGVKAGLNVSNLSGFGDFSGMAAAAGSTFETNFKPGFNAGLMLQYDFTTSLFLQPELLYSNLGTKTTLKLVSNEVTETLNLNYLQLPIYLGYRFDLGGGLNLIAGVGPYLGYGLSGTDKAFDGDDGVFKRFDAGLTVMAGIQFNKLQIALGYDHGLVDMVDVQGWDTAKDLLDLSSINNRNIKVSVGYFF